jgi:hypothetical protein
MTRRITATFILLAATLGCARFVATALRHGETSRAGDPLPLHLQAPRPPRGTPLAQAAVTPRSAPEPLCPARHVWEPVLRRFQRSYIPRDIADRRVDFIRYLSARAQGLGHSARGFTECYEVAERFVREEAGDERLPIAPGAVAYSHGRWTFVLFVFRGPPDQRPSTAEPRCLIVDELTLVVTPCQ